MGGFLGGGGGERQPGMICNQQNPIGHRSLRGRCPKDDGGSGMCSGCGSGVTMSANRDFKSYP